ncbi:ANTAR domain-containing protein [Pedococcus sp. 2YAF34]|uniref:ANTAR domain-containing protein n=1 Tax=Pedococcus sp. 2YAF34 TaxID=3233032 RepID=UPI003F967D12
MPLHAAAPEPGAAHFQYDVVADRWTWSPELRALHGLPADAEPTTALLLDHVVDGERDTVAARVQHAVATPGAFSWTYRLTTAGGPQRTVVVVGRSEKPGDRVVRLLGFLVDITEAVRERTDAAVAAASEHRATIEQAKGALMLGFGVEEDVAFELLRSHSNQHNIKLSTVAYRVVSGLTERGAPSDDPVRSLLDTLLSAEGFEGASAG